MKINTVQYGRLPIAKSNKWLQDDILDCIEGCDEDEFYEIRLTLNGVVVAYQVPLEVM